MITELHQTLAAGNELALSVGVLVEALKPGPPDNTTPAAHREPAKPFDIDDYRHAIADHLFLRSLLLIVIALTGYVIARLVHEWLALRLVRRSQ